MTSNHNGQDVGLILPNSCRITHGHGGTIKKPFPQDMPDLTMHELLPSSRVPFKGQLGFIPFTTHIRLPRHIHMDLSRSTLIDERIMVLHGVGLVELAGEYWVVAPGSLVEAKGGVPHAWTACPAGVRVPDGDGEGTVSDGTFTMVYEYEGVTKFYPTANTQVVREPGRYRPFEGTEYEAIRIPAMSAQEVVERATAVVGKEIVSLKLA